MDADNLEILRLRYRAAYDAYRQRVRQLGQKIESGAVPSEAEIAEEAKTLDALTKARQELFDALARLAE